MDWLARENSNNKLSKYFWQVLNEIDKKDRRKKEQKERKKYK